MGYYDDDSDYNTYDQYDGTSSAILGKQSGGAGMDASFLESIREMVRMMKKGTLEFDTSINKGLPVQFPGVYQKITKCVSADPLFKLCFSVNPNKKTVHVQVRVPAFKKAIDAALQAEDMTVFQQRMFGTKWGMHYMTLLNISRFQRWIRCLKECDGVKN